MKILIVDDEKLTREGIIASIDWGKLGILEIYEADDGINGIKLGKLHKPDIIISDVRMPRMNGIEMIKELRKEIPIASIILMSGYSDREYLKEAIRLKVISYVEKPIDAIELEASIKNAIETQLLHVKNQITIDTHLKYRQSKLALQVIYTGSKELYLDYTKQFQDLGYPIKPTTEFTTIIITLKTAISSILEQNINEIYYVIDEIAKKYRANNILAIKNDEYIILHLFSNNKISEYMIQNICNSISVYLKKSYQYFIAVGKTVHGIRNISESYNSAVLLLQSSFFYEYNSIIVSEASATTPTTFNQSDFSRYTEALNEQNKEEVLEIVTSLFHNHKNNQHILPTYVKDLYYNLFLILFQTASNLHITIFYNENSATILDYISRNNSLSELNQLLLDKINLLFSSLEEATNDNVTVYAIKEFISKNYRNEQLSVKDISEHVYLSSSYVCTLFKNETGKTLNQYLTEFRLEKAKKLLMDSRCKISDISAKVGYSDGNYFGKTFKKLVGLSPSEYRERFIK